MPENKPTQSQMLVQLLQDMAELRTIIRQIADHEDRIRELERARWKSAWLTGILSAAIASTVVGAIMKITIGE
jgi:gamma-glutamyl phosphate reductase